MDIKNLICIVCPKGCMLKVSLEAGKVVSVSGNACKRGAIYGEAECTNPTRTLTTTVKVLDGKAALVPVKSNAPLPKGLITDCMKIINQFTIKAPVAIGEIVVENILDTGINIVATSNVEIFID